MKDYKTIYYNEQLMMHCNCDHIKPFGFYPKLKTNFTECNIDDPLEQATFDAIEKILTHERGSTIVYDFSTIKAKIMQICVNDTFIDILFSRLDAENEQRVRIEGKKIVSGLCFIEEDTYLQRIRLSANLKTTIIQTTKGNIAIEQ